jgi:ubiquinone/menaquinone biosynthesis C-methylase UbiE
MTWEETIQHIRTQPEYSELVEKAYFDADLELNVSRFNKSLEFEETLRLIKKHAPKAKTILDIGCGNGISTINFALQGYDVTAVEPDVSTTVGAGAIKILKHAYNLKNVIIHEDFAEHIKFSDDTFDVVYMRQAMHHANDLDRFLKESIRVLKPNGLLLTIRDHVIFNEDDKNWFLEKHPLHKFYGGENAYTSGEYKQAIVLGGATILKELKYYDNEINYFPLSNTELIKIKQHRIAKQQDKLFKKIGVLAKLPLVWSMYKLLFKYSPLSEKLVPGRMYSYIAIKE